MKFKRGEISASDYIQQSGALTQALEAELGLPVSELAEVAQRISGEKFTQSWADAAEQFRANHPDWIDGEQNKDLLGNIIAENQWVDAEDKLAAMEAAYKYAVENDLLVSNPEVELYKNIEIRRMSDGGNGRLDASRTAGLV